MRSRTGIQKAAQKLHKKTGAPYQECLQVLQKHKSEAEKLKGEETKRPFTECLIETGLRYISSSNQ